MDPLRTFVERVFEVLIRKDYPHLRYPPCVYAKVVDVTQKGSVYTATLRILDKNKQKDPYFDDIPLVKTDMEIRKGDIVAAVLLYGEADPFIVGRCC